MSVHLTPELEEKLRMLAAQTGQPPEQLLEDALSGYDPARMAALDWSQCDAVERVPSRVSGAIRGMGHLRRCTHNWPTSGDNTTAQAAARLRQEGILAG